MHKLFAITYVGLFLAALLIMPTAGPAPVLSLVFLTLCGVVAIILLTRHCHH